MFIRRSLNKLAQLRVTYVKIRMQRYPPSYVQRFLPTAVKTLSHLTFTGYVKSAGISRAAVCLEATKKGFWSAQLSFPGPWTITYAHSLLQGTEMKS